jgi:hypothetical protein
MWNEKVVENMLGKKGLKLRCDTVSLNKTKHNKWDVYLNNKKIDSVFFDKDLKSDYVKDSLINHDGYDFNINVKKDYKW